MSGYFKLQPQNISGFVTISLYFNDQVALDAAMSQKWTFNSPSQLIKTLARCFHHNYYGLPKMQDYRNKLLLENYPMFLISFDGNGKSQINPLINAALFSEQCFFQFFLKELAKIMIPDAESVMEPSQINMLKSLISSYFFHSKMFDKAADEQGILKQLLSIIQLDRISSTSLELLQQQCTNPENKMFLQKAAQAIKAITDQKNKIIQTE